MKMDIVDLNDPRFVLCKHFIKACNKGKGQNIRVSISANNVKEFLNTKAAKLYADKGSNFWGPRINEEYILKAMKAIERAIRQVSACAYFFSFNSGDWQGTNRKNELLEFEQKLKALKEIYNFLDYIDFDCCCFRYMDNFYLDTADKLTISINPYGESMCSDLGKLIKFLELLGYEKQKSQAVNLSTIWFYDLDIEKLSENKTIWEFL